MSRHFVFQLLALTCCCLMSQPDARSQQQNMPLPADSLMRVLAIAKPDTARVNLLIALSASVRDTNVQLALGYINEAARLSGKLAWPNGRIRATVAMGRCYDIVSQHDKAITYYWQALAMAKSSPALGAEEVEVLYRIAESYYIMKRNDSVYYYRKATLARARQVGNEWLEEQSLNYLAGYAYDQKKFPLALQQWNDLSALYAKRGKNKSIPMVLNNISSAYSNSGASQKAFAALREALDINRQFPDERSRSYILYNLSDEYNRNGMPDSAIYYARAALKSARSALGERTIEILALEMIIDLNEKKGNYRQSLEDYKTFIRLRDSVKDNRQKAEGRKTLMVYEFNRQMNDAHQERDQLRRENAQRRQALIISLTSLLLFAAFAALLLRGWLRIRRQRNTIRSQSLLLDKRAQALAQALDEKELLMKEIHHRVKNNLQMISALQHLQAARSKDPVVRAALEDSQNRVLSIAFIHQNLYQHNDLDKVDMQSLIRELAGHIQDMYGHGDRAITITQDVAPLPLDIDTAVPVGLMLNELLTNSCKHAFAGRTEGHITIRLKQEPADDTYVLEYEDDGPGLPADTDFSSARTLGLRLISRLADQLDGVLRYLPAPEGRLIFTFRDFAARNKN